MHTEGSSVPSARRRCVSCDHLGLTVTARMRRAVAVLLNLTIAQRGRGIRRTAVPAVSSGLLCVSASICSPFIGEAESLGARAGLHNATPSSVRSRCSRTRRSCATGRTIRAGSTAPFPRRVAGLAVLLGEDIKPDPDQYRLQPAGEDTPRQAWHLPRCFRWIPLPAPSPGQRHPNVSTQPIIAGWSQIQCASSMGK